MGHNIIGNIHVGQKNFGQTNIGQIDFGRRVGITFQRPSFEGV